MTLDAAQTSQIADVFSNGFFVEGYLLLSGAENCCDISVPLVGFHGDWAQLPIFNDYECFKIARFGGSSVILKDSYAKLIQLMLDIQAQIPEEALTDPDADLLSLMDQYATEEQLDALYAPAEFFYASPNGDGLADMIGCNFYTQRYCHFEGLTLYDADNKLALEGEVAPLTLRGAHVTLETLDEWDEVPEGAYTAQISCYINDPESEAHPQVLSFPVTIDRTAPEITTSVRDEDGRRILILIFGILHSNQPLLNY